MLSAAALCGGWARPARAVSDVCEDICFQRQDEGLFSCQRKCKQTDDRVRLPVGLQFLAEREQTYLKPPMPDSVAVTPDNPGPGDTMRVSVKLLKLPDSAGTPDVRLHYSFDGMQTWHTAEAELNPKAGVYDGYIPMPTDSPGLNWFLRILTDDQNAYVEMPCAVKSFPFDKNDCLIPLAGDSSYADYENFHVDPSVDILGSKIGEDEKNYYFLYSTAGNISKGKSIPSMMNMYLIAIIDPSLWTKTETMNNVAFIAYSPLLFAPADCALIMRRADNWITDTTAPTCIVKDNLIMIRVKKSLLMKFQLGYFKVFLATDMIIDDNMSIIKDYTGVTVVKLGVHREMNFSPNK